MLKVTLFFALATIIGVYTAPAPQEDIKTAVLLAAGHMKEMADNGAAMQNSKSIDFFGMKAQNDMAMGFGDAMSGRRRRDTTINMVNVVNMGTPSDEDDDDDDNDGSD